MAAGDPKPWGPWPVLLLALALLALIYLIVQADLAEGHEVPGAPPPSTDTASVAGPGALAASACRLDGAAMPA